MPHDSLRLDDFRMQHRVRVRWTEVDPQNVVFNGHYLGLADLGTTEYWRALALPYPYAFERMGGDVVVRKAGLELLSPARFDDWLEVAVRCERFGRSSIHLLWGIFRGHEVLAHGDLVYVFIDPDAERAAPVPELLRGTVDAYEAGQLMLEARIGDWDAFREDAVALRDEVFVREHGIDAALERDDEDADARHAVVYNRAGWAMGTARLVQSRDGEARIGRVAVRREMRGSGVGRLLIDTLLGHCERRGEAHVIVQAQTQAAGFFSRLGFTPRGEPFDVAGLPHITMVRPLK